MIQYRWQIMSEPYKKSSLELELEAKLKAVQEEVAKKQSNVEFKDKGPAPFNERKIMEAYLGSLLDNATDTQYDISHNLEDLKPKDDLIPEEPVETDWREAPFKALLFRLYNMTIAVPLFSLSGVVSAHEKISKIPGRPFWYHGMLRRRGQQIHVADPAHWLMREGARDDLSPIPYRFFICVDSLPWAIACHEVMETKLLFPKDIKWRSEGGTTPWLQGTVVEHMWSLLDLEPLVNEMNKNYKKTAIE